MTRDDAMRQQDDDLLGALARLSGGVTVADLVESTTLSEQEVRAALATLVARATEQGRRADDVRDDLITRLLADPSVLDPIPHAAVAQARRIASRRNHLLASGAWSIARLTEVRDARRATVRTWVTRQRAAARIFTVTAGGETWVPALLLDAATDVHPGSQRAIRPLRDAGMDPWALWVWFDSPSTWLDGDRPADLLATGDVDRLAVAAEAQASNAIVPTADVAVA